MGFNLINYDDKILILYINNGNLKVKFLCHKIKIKLQLHYL